MKMFLKKVTFFKIYQLLPKRVFIIFFDLAICFFALWIAFFLRLDKFYHFNKIPIYPLVISLALLTVIIFSFQIHKSINRHSGLESFIELSKALVVYSIIFASIFALNTFEGVPRTIGIIQPILMSFSILSSRAIIRYIFLIFSNFKQQEKFITNCLIYGAGNTGIQLAKIIKDDKTLNFIGYLDDNDQLINTKINNKFVYSPTKLDKIKLKYNIAIVILAIPSIEAYNKTKILLKLQKLNITLRTLPNLNELTSGKIDLSNLRDLNINDLLGRDPAGTNKISHAKNIYSKNVLVTGGGGSIGSELCRQILQLSPKSIIIVEINEFFLYQIFQEIKEKLSDKKIKVIPKLVSILNYNVLANIFETYKPDIIFHAAAYKHVSIVEDNPIVGLNNNVFGTLNIANLALKHKVNYLILISTDKAVRPTNIMGASKRLSELIIQAFQARTKSSIFSMVRFGNVLGSSGSVVPKFFKQIQSGGPITITDKRVTRYFMTIHEAVNLVIKSSIISKGGEVFVLDMGDPIKIIDLAKKMALLSGKIIKDKYNRNGDIEIKITGLSVGEKLYEELLIGNNPVKTNVDKILTAQENYLEWKELKKHLYKLEISLKENNMKEIKNIFIKTGIFYNH